MYAVIGITGKVGGAVASSLLEAGQSVRAVTEQCLRLGLVPSLIGSGMAVEQAPAAGAQVMRGSQVTVRFGRAGEIVPVSTAGGGN